MPAPIFAYALFTALGIAAGAWMRQPEIDRLKAQVKALQAEVHKLRGMIEEQKRHIMELKLRYDALNFLRVFEKQRVASDVKVQIMHYCSFKEYLAIALKRSRGEQIAKEQQKFLRAYEMLAAGNDDQLSEEDFDFMAGYVEEKYADAIENMSIPGIDAELQKLEQFV